MLLDRAISQVLLDLTGALPLAPRSIQSSANSGGTEYIQMAEKCSKMLNASSQNYSEAPLMRCSYTTDNESFGFTFLIPSNIVRGFIKEIDSIKFTCLGYKWRVLVVRTKMHIGAFLNLIPTKPLTDLELRADLSFTILNREHFSKSQHFSQRQIVFNMDARRHGCATLIELADLCGDKFLSDDNTFLLEVEFSSPRIDILVQLHTTYELVSFLCNTYVDRYNAEDGEHRPILFESGPFNISGQSWHLGVALSHASVFGPERGKKKVSLYIFRRRGRKSPGGVSGRRLSFVEFACEIESQTSDFRFQFLLDPGYGISLTKDLPLKEADAVAALVREQIADHIAKKVSFKQFNPVLRVRLRSVQLRHLTPRKLTLQSLESGLYYSPIPFEPVNTQWSTYAYSKENDFRLGLQVGVDKDDHFLDSNFVDLLWWSAHSGTADVESVNLLGNDQKVALSVATLLHQLHGLELTPPSTDDMTSYEEVLIEALSPSQCLVNFRGQNQKDSPTHRLQRNVDVILEWHAEYRLRGDHFDLVDVLTHIHMHQMRKELTILRRENASLKEKIRNLEAAESARSQTG